MPKRITFHRHEVVGAQMTRDLMKRLGFEEEEIEEVSTLVRNHQFRFYSDTKESTLRKWLEQLGKSNYCNIFFLRIADRIGNDKNKDKPPVTKELKDLKDKCYKMVINGKVVFPEDLVVSEKDLFKLKIPKHKHKIAIKNMLGIVRANKNRNNRSYLLKYLKDNYKDK